MVGDGRCHCRGCDQARVQGAEDVAKRIRELHKADNLNQCITCTGDCWTCGEWGCEGDYCKCECHIYYPCPTIKALDGTNGSLEDV